MLSSCLGAARAQAQQVAENMKSGGMDFSKMAEMMGGMGGGGGGGGELACALIRPPLAVPPAPFYRSVRLACAMSCEGGVGCSPPPQCLTPCCPFPPRRCSV